MDFREKIDIRYFADEWGPYSISLETEEGESALPTDQFISTCVIKAYTGKIKPGDSVSGLVDYADELIEGVSVLLKQVFWNFQYPTTAALIGQKMTLIFEVTTNTGGKFPFYLYYVKIV